MFFTSLTWSFLASFQVHNSVSGKTTFTRQLENESVYRARMPKNYGYRYLERSIEARTDRLNHVIMRSFPILVTESIRSMVIP